ncbi:unnamed protein product [Symbiodinium sp. CCMP2592]|nr:unnamed protein product [Symbiodinium sp. CCMP2592]
MTKKEALIEWITWLEDWAVQLEAVHDPGRFRTGRAKGGWSYKAQCLLDCWRLSLKVRSLHSMKGAVERSMALVLPAAVADELLFKSSDPSGEGPTVVENLPSAWTLQRAKARIDISYMLCMQGQNSLPGALSILRYDSKMLFPTWASWVSTDSGEAETAGAETLAGLRCRYMSGPWFADSSPQGGRDWFLSASSSIEVTGLLRAARAMDFLQETATASPDREFDEAGELSEACFQCSQKRRQSLELLEKACDRHMHVPVVLGSKATDLPNKAAALLHSLRLETLTADCLRATLASTVSFTSDMGVESGLADFPKVDMNVLSVADLPVTDIVQDDMDDERPCDEKIDDGDFMFPHTLVVCGVLHILANATSQVHERMGVWQAFKPQLQAVARFLHYAHYRQRLKSTCFGRRTRFSMFADYFNTGCPLPIEWRWLITQHVLEYILGLEHALLAGWNLKTYLSDAPPSAGEGGGDGIDEDAPAHVQKDSENAVSLDQVDAALRSPMFWATAKMIFHLGESIRAVEGWAKGCPCHPTDGHAHLSGFRQQALVNAELGRPASDQSFTCPGKGKRAPELAANKLVQNFQTISQTHYAFVLAACQSVTEEQRAELLRQSPSTAEASFKASFFSSRRPPWLICPVVHFFLQGDFEGGKNHLLYVLEMKFNAWRKLPLRLCGLGLPSQHAGLVQEIARDCLQQYAAQPDPSLHHRVSNLCCAPGSPLYDSMVRVANGEPLERHSQLQKVASILKLIPVAEHVIEGPHASTQREVLRAPRCGPAAISLALRGPEIERYLNEGPVYAGYLLAENLESIPNVASALPRLGLEQHPLLLRLQSAGLKVTNGTACDIIYRCDAESQFLNLRGARKAVQNAKETEKQKREECEKQRSKKLVARKLDSADRPDWLFQTLLFDFLREQDVETYVFSMHVPEERPPPKQSMLAEAEAVVPALAADRSGSSSAALSGKTFRPMQSVISSAAAAPCEKPTLPLLHVLDDCGECEDAAVIAVSAAEEQTSAVEPDTVQMPSFFRVVHKRPSRQKMQQVAPAVGQKLKASDIAVTRHACLEISDTAAKVEACPVMCTKDSSTFLLDTTVPLGARSALAGNLMLWDFSTVHEHTLRGVSEQLLGQLVQLGAFEGRAARFQIPSPDSEAGLELGRQLVDAEAKGLVTSEEVCEGSFGWQLTRSGMSQMQMLFRLCRPRALCALQESCSEDALLDQHPCQTWMLLEKHGWKPEVCSKKQLSLQAPYSEADSEAQKLFFLSSSGSATPPRWYLLSLALADLVWKGREDPPLLPVMHSWSVAQYKGFVESRGTCVPDVVRKLKLQALQDDDGFAALPEAPAKRKRTGKKGAGRGRAAKIRRKQSQQCELEDCDAGSPEPLPEEDPHTAGDSGVVDGDEEIEAAAALVDVSEVDSAESSPCSDDMPPCLDAVDDADDGGSSSSGSGSSSSSSDSSSSSSGDSSNSDSSSHHGPAAAAAVAAGPRLVSEDSHKWGVFHITWRRPGETNRFGGWSTKCPFHVAGSKACSRSLNVSEASDKQTTLDRLHDWCNSAAACLSREEHMGLPRRPDHLQAEQLDQGMLTEDDLQVFLGA